MAAVSTDRAVAARLTGIAVVSVTVDETGAAQNPRFVAFYDSLQVIGSARVVRDKNGNVDHLSNAQIRYAGKKISDPLGLDEVALNTVRNWRFIPATREGKPVASVIQIDVSFIGSK